MASFQFTYYQNSLQDFAFLILLFKLNWDYKILTITEKKPNEFNSGLKTRYHTRANGHIPGSLKRRPTIHKTTLPKNDLKMIELENNDPKHEGLEKEVAFKLIIIKKMNNWIGFLSP